ncbi:hypothetical protein ACFWIV_28880 [Streptomyces virginiae]|uniref:hypothetical protein n=1 Tax=Streptomyces virginiae TaxID=1961 RepID=UPI00365A6797
MRPHEGVEAGDPVATPTEGHLVEKIYFVGGPLDGVVLPAPVPAPWMGGWYRFEQGGRWTLYVPACRMDNEVLAKPRRRTRA